MRGFSQLTKDEIEMLLSCNEFGELYFPFYNKERFEKSPHLALDSLVKRGVLIEGAPYRLSKKGIKTKNTLQT